MNSFVLPIPSFEVEARKIQWFQQEKIQEGVESRERFWTLPKGNNIYRPIEQQFSPNNFLQMPSAHVPIRPAHLLKQL